MKDRRENSVGRPGFLTLVKADIASKCRINPTTLPRYLARLVDSRHVEKDSADDDKRERLFRLTVRGSVCFC